jgi:hypothetical protein
MQTMPRSLVAASSAGNNPKRLFTPQPSEDGIDPVLDGHNLAVSIFVQGSSGPLTYHSTALNESFLSGPNAGDVKGDESDINYPYETNHFFLVDAVDVWCRPIRGF